MILIGMDHRLVLVCHGDGAVLVGVILTIPVILTIIIGMDIITVIGMATGTDITVVEVIIITTMAIMVITDIVEAGVVAPILRMEKIAETEHLHHKTGRAPMWL